MVFDVSVQECCKTSLSSTTGTPKASISIVKFD